MTDHESLQYWYTEDLNKMTASVPRRGRWHEFLSQFNLEVVYVPGKTQVVSDVFSRAPWVYPCAPDEADATFHGPPQAQEYADKCEYEDSVLDSFVNVLGLLYGMSSFSRIVSLYNESFKDCFIRAGRKDKRR